MNFDSEGFGIINGHYVIACTTTFGKVGDYIDFYQEDGSVIQCIIGDIKSPNDAGYTEWGHSNGQNIIEFIVNKDTWYIGNVGNHANPGTNGFHMEWNQNLIKAINRGNYFDSPNFGSGEIQEDESQTGENTLNGTLMKWPTDGTNITSYFGLRNDVWGGSEKDNHGGIDIAVAKGTNVYATEAGTVITASMCGDAGNLVTIDHGNGYITKYMHNSAFKVSAGDKVEKGQIIALSGSTGNSTGPHVHFQVEYKGERIDPLTFKYDNGMGGGTGGFGSNTGSLSTNDTIYAKVATWNERTEKIESDDPSVAEKNETIYQMTTTKIDYQKLVSGYKMPFDYLWALLVIGQEKEFVFDLADLVYNSQIEITVHDNLTENTTVTEDTYESTETYTNKDGIEVSRPVTYTTIYTVITKTNVLDIKLTRANVWIVDYKQEFTYTASSESNRYISSPPQIIEKTDKQAIEPNFVTLLTKYRRVQGNIESAKDWLFEILKSIPNTVGVDMIDITKYLLYKTNGYNYGVREYDFSIYEPKNFQTVNTIANDLLRTYIRQWEHSTPPPTNADGTKYIIEKDPVGNAVVGYGIDIFNGGYANLFRKAGYPTSIGGEVDKEFVDGLEKREIENITKRVRTTTAGLNLEEYQIHALVSRAYNCGVYGAMTVRRGSPSLNFVNSYDKYWKADEDNLFKKKDKNANFGHDLYTQYMIKPVTANDRYLPGLERRRKSEWILFQTGYYDVLDKWYQEESLEDAD